MSSREVLEFFFHHVLKYTSTEWKLKHFNGYIKALKNYFMFIFDMDINIMKQILDVIENINNHEEI